MAESRDEGQDPVQHPYFRGVIREGLRLSWANPTRLPRSVPPGGWAFKGFIFSPGTSVGVSAFQLHQDERVFKDALKFDPTRWLDPTETMLTNWMAFGKGMRSCIAQNLATVELNLATLSIVESDVLRRARPVQDRIEIKEWFNSRVNGEKILLEWDR